MFKLAPSIIVCYQTLSIQSADYIFFDNMPVVSDNMPVESDNMLVEGDNMPVDSDNMQRNRFLLCSCL